MDDTNKPQDTGQMPGVPAPTGGPVPTTGPAMPTPPGSEPTVPTPTPTEPEVPTQAPQPEPPTGEGGATGGDTGPIPPPAATY